MYRLEQRHSLQKQIPENPTASPAERLSVYRLTYRQSPQQLGGPTGMSDWCPHSTTKAKGNITSGRPDLGSIASAVKGVALCQLCEQKTTQHQLHLQSRLV